MESASRPVPHRRSWWVDDHLLAGAYPGTVLPADAVVKVASVVAAGVTLFLDLTTPADGLAPCGHLLSGTSARRVALPVPDMTPPTDAVVLEGLALVDAEAAAGGIAYVHCWGGIGRTGCIVGCHLARALGDPAALDRLAYLRVASADARRRAPETEAQRALVDRWPRTT